MTPPAAAPAPAVVSNVNRAARRPVRSASTGADAAEVTKAVRSHCEGRLARFKWPRSVTVVADLPHSATGKVAKGRLRAQARRELLGLG